MEWLERGRAVTWTVDDPAHATTRADVSVTAVEVDVHLWGERPAGHDARQPTLRALTLEADQARTAKLGAGSRILLDRDRYGNAPSGTLSPRYARVRAIGARRNGRILVHIDWCREDAHAIYGVAETGAPNGPQERVARRGRATEFEPRPPHDPRSTIEHMIAGGSAIRAVKLQAPPDWATAPGRAPLVRVTEGTCKLRSAPEHATRFDTLLVTTAFAQDAGLEPGALLHLEIGHAADEGTVVRTARAGAVEKESNGIVEVSIIQEQAAGDR